MTDRREGMVALTTITTEEEGYEAAGIVADALLNDGMIDDELGAVAELKPIEIARRHDGTIAYVVCARRVPVHGLDAAREERVLVPA